MIPRLPHLLAALAMLALLTQGCCVEGQPAWKRRTINAADVPANVRKAFSREYDLADVDGVQKASFKSWCAGDRFDYRFTLKNGNSITLDKSGRLDRWPLPIN